MPPRPSSASRRYTPNCSRSTRGPPLVRRQPPSGFLAGAVGRSLGTPEPPRKTQTARLLDEEPGRPGAAGASARERDRAVLLRALRLATGAGVRVGRVRR